MSEQQVPIIGGVLLFALGDPELDFELTSETLSGALSVRVQLTFDVRKQTTLH